MNIPEGTKPAVITIVFDPSDQGVALGGRRQPPDSAEGNSPPIQRCRAGAAGGNPEQHARVQVRQADTDFSCTEIFPMSIAELPRHRHPDP